MTGQQSREINRQAVVIIHGLGEQRPMQTLREFVEGITTWIKEFDPNRQRPRYWSRPDHISESFETRRITMERTAGNPKTDFYEFYWAHNMRNTSFSHLLPWLWKLVSTRYMDIPPRLKNLWLLIRGLVLTMGVFLVLFFFFREKIGEFLPEQLALTVTALIISFPFGRWILRMFQVPLSQFVLNTAGDAARYFNPIPSNIQERSTIRRDGIAFLKKLHEQQEKPYDRIIVVGHSLGSVVAYDMIRLLWNEMHETFKPSETLSHSIFDRMDAASNQPDTLTNIHEFQQLQHQCWKQYRANGNPWLISDFISCAGAIAHADFYLLSKVPFVKLIKQKEFPVCPPVMEGNDRTLFFGEKTHDIPLADNSSIKRTVKFLNHGAPFAVTRWTNIYFSSDYIGSEARRVFGPGIRDVEIPRKSYWFLPGGHTNYWDPLPKNQALAEIAKVIGFHQLPADYYTR